MPTIIFRGAVIRHADLRFDDEAGGFFRIHLTAEWTAPVREAMAWEEVPDWVDRAKLVGLIAARHLILTPNGRELKQHELQIDISEVSDFQLVRMYDEEGQPKRSELRFVARGTQRDAMALIEAYRHAVGRSPGQLKVTHEVQDKLELGEEQAPVVAGAIASKAEVDWQSGQLDKMRARGAKEKE